MPTHTAFFYGTLMAPAVLNRVCHGTADPSPHPSHRISPALLPGHRRHRVRYADYPAVLPHAGSTVRGTLVTGLSDRDIGRLDIFEGAEYERRTVKARRILRPHGQNDAASVLPPGEATPEADLVLGEEVEAETYIWVGRADDLEDQEWDLAEFMREKMMKWVGEVDPEEGIQDVDDAVAAQKTDPTRGRGLNGAIGKELEEEHKKGGRGEVLESAV